MEFGSTSSYDFGSIEAATYSISERSRRLLDTRNESYHKRGYPQSKNLAELVNSPMELDSLLADGISSFFHGDSSPDSIIQAMIEAREGFANYHMTKYRAGVLFEKEDFSTDKTDEDLFELINWGGE